MDLDHICDHIAVSQRIVDAVMSLGNAVTDIRCIISGASCSCVGDSSHGFLYKLIQMGASRMAVPEGALYQDLGLIQILHRPSHTNL